MPAQYEAMRDKFKKSGMSMDKAQSKAAAIYNSKHPGAPISGKAYDKKKKKGKKGNPFKKAMRG